MNQVRWFLINDLISAVYGNGSQGYWAFTPRNIWSKPCKTIKIQTNTILLGSKIFIKFYVSFMWI